MKSTLNIDYALLEQQASILGRLLDKEHEGKGGLLPAEQQALEGVWELLEWLLENKP